MDAFMKKCVSMYGFGVWFGKAKLDERKRNKIRRIMDEGIRSGDESMVWMARDLAYVVKEQCPEFLEEMHDIMRKHKYV